MNLHTHNHYTLDANTANNSMDQMICQTHLDMWFVCKSVVVVVVVVVVGAVELAACMLHVADIRHTLRHRIF
jgi:hypothetical protein